MLRAVAQFVGVLARFTTGRWSDVTRQLYECREPGILNLRTVCLRGDGALVFEGHDLDKDLEQFVGRDEWEGETTVAASEIPKLREALRHAFGPLPKPPTSEAEELLDLIEKGFGGDIRCMTRFEEWCREQHIEFTTWSY